MRTTFAIFFCFIAIFVLFLDSRTGAAIVRTREKREPPLFIDWTAPRTGPTPYGVPGYRPGYAGGPDIGPGYGAPGYGTPGYGAPGYGVPGHCSGGGFGGGPIGAYGPFGVGLAGLTQGLLFGGK
ncbi:hypothetical protein DdX_15563 [Ditylenchus destructor]|uniref:Uncharacterized protein n=1 Tax=Ditylenchus destructor TaxID=166010 RepID=A0AAD4MQM6_9BILA|nr:hypothetical protein DdX_15563 [Ditylenchus destructor]